MEISGATNKHCPNESNCPSTGQCGLSRRRFLKIFSIGTALSGLFSKPFLTSVFADDSNSAIFKIRISDYPELQNVGGSIRIGVNPVRYDFEAIYPDGDFYPVVINRAENNVFYALNSYCQHQGCVVPTYDAGQGKIICECHGSEYTINGDLLAEPAETPLQVYESQFDGNDTLTFKVPDMGFYFTATPATGSSTPRFRLTFETRFNVTYEIFFRPSLTDPWTRIPFSNTLNGPADQQDFPAISLPATIYVDSPAPSGFFAIAMKLGEV